MYDEQAAALREAAEGGKRVRVRGAGTKLAWGEPTAAPDVELSTAPLDRILEHNAGDLTAVVQAGVAVERLQEELAAAGQMLALDPPVAGGATVGGVLATADSGPLRHRYGGPRDLVLGVTVALSDGTLARAGGKVIKNVAGYDLAKLFTGSFGSLGAILEVALRLHPLPHRTLTAVGEAADPDAVAAAASALAHSPTEAQCLDVRWDDGRGAVLVRLAGVEAQSHTERAVAALERHGLDARTVEDDAELWEEQRAGQRSAGGTVVRVSGVQEQLATQMRAAERAGGSLVGRAAYGLAWIALPEATAGGVGELRRELAPSPCVVLDAPAEVREAVDVWGAGDATAVDLMRRVKQRFDPANACNPGVFVGGL
jgi:glycolate dehydrogenase FAD-binding subunit